MSSSAIRQEQLEDALLGVDRAAIAEIARRLSSSQEPLSLFEVQLSRALARIGDDWERGELSLAQVYMAGRLAEELLDGLGLNARTRPQAGGPRLAMAVLEDHHLLGKRLVLAALRVSGWPVDDWGVAEGPKALAERAHAEKIDVLLLSTLMLRAALRVKDVVVHLRALGAPTKVVVGGAPYRLDRELWQRVGADATADNATDVPKLMERMLGRRP